jgi:hypothetical protein
VLREAVELDDDRALLIADAPRTMATAGIGNFIR